MSASPRAWRSFDAAVTLLPAPADADRGRTLAALLGCRADAIVLRRDDTGKPRLAGPAGAACSFARCDGARLVAAAWGGALGADLEAVRPELDACGIAGAFFVEEEARWLRALPPPRRDLAFTALWVVKEAVLKMTGRGIAGGLAAPGVDGEALAPLLAGAARLELAVPGAEVQLRRVRLGGRDAVAGIARRRALS